jgi:hypothetical protein
VLESWSDFFVAAAGASAALAGLIIVAMSVSIDQLITIPGMTSRGATAIAMLMLVAVTSLVGLVPDLQALPFGLTLVAAATFGLVLAVRSLWLLLRAGAVIHRYTAAIAKGVIGILPFLAFLLGGVLLATSTEGGLVLMVVGTFISFVLAVVDAWIMLVEIRR